jgi:hypothetical protein
MNRVLHFPRNEEEVWMTVLCRMRRRIPAATLPCTSREHSRIHGRIPFLNRKNGEGFFWSRTTCTMPSQKCLPQGFLLTFEIEGLA